MPTQSLQEPLWTPSAAALRRQAGTLWDAWRHGLQRWAHAAALRRADRELAEMSLHTLRDIGAPEPLLQRRQHRYDVLQLPPG